MNKKRIQFYCTCSKERERFHDDPHMLYLSSEKGYLNKTLFEYIVIEFAKWRQVTRFDLDCFMISDNLPVHKKKDIIELAEGMDIHIYNIMPGSSHWFQVHDQQPFGALKKKMSQKKN